MTEKKYDVLRLEDGDYPTTFNKMYLSRKPWHRQDERLLLSFMPGTVETINVKEGESVKKGDILMIFRAMKMENKILAPFDGRVKAVHVKTGENLSKNTVMIEME